MTDTTGGLVNKVGTTVTMLGNTLTTNVTSGQLGQVTGGVNDKVLVPVISTGGKRHGPFSQRGSSCRQNTQAKK